MKRFNLVLVILLGMALVIPTHVSAVTNQGLEWNIQEGDEFYFEMYASNYYASDEEVYFVIEDIPPVIPGSIDEWSEIPQFAVDIYFTNGTSIGINEGMFVFCRPYVLPIGNFGLLSDLFIDVFNQGDYQYYDNLTIRSDVNYWGFSYSTEIPTQILDICVYYQKDDGFLAKYEIHAYNTTAPGQHDLFLEVKVIRDEIDPLIEGPLDMEFYVDDISNYLIWYVSDENPAEYEIKLNGLVIDYGNWTSDISYFAISLKDLGVGYYIYSIEVSDYKMNTATDTVTVTILESPTITGNTVPTDTNSEPSLFGIGWLSLSITIGSICVIGVFGFLIFRSNKEHR